MRLLIPSLKRVGRPAKHVLLPALYASHEPADTLRRPLPETAAETFYAAAFAFALRAEDECKKSEKKMADIRCRKT